jgi:hypothetical protein
VAATTQLVIPARAATPLALWHLFSLDAPSIAALWTWFVAHVFQVSLPLAAPVAMALAVWILYATDRLLDAQILDTHLSDARVPRPRGSGARPRDQATYAMVLASPQDRLEERHLFHHRHRKAFLSTILAAALALAALLPRLDPAAVRLYLIEGGVLLSWFLVLHATSSAHRLPKEIAVGLFFSAAIFIPTVARDPARRLDLLPCAALFAALCSLNCLFIYAWEHEDGRLANPEQRLANARPPHPTTRIALAHLTVLDATVTISAIVLAILHSLSSTPAGETLLPCACAISSVLLLLLHRHRGRFSRVHLRAAADMTLLTPMLLLPFLR